MSDDGAIYEGRKATGRSWHQPRIPKSSSEIEPRIAIARGGEIRHDYLEPELAHPGEEMGRIPENMSSGMAKAATFRNIAKQMFVSVVKETVELVALEAASKALQEEINDQQRAAHSSMGSNGGRSRERPRTSPIPPPASRPPLPCEDSAAGASSFDTFSPRRFGSGRRHGSNASTSAYGSFDRHGTSGTSADASRGGRQPESMSVSRRNGVSNGGGGGERGVGAGAMVPRRGDIEKSLSFRDTGNNMEDQEREMLLALLTGAYDQVNELTDELQLSLQKLHETEKELKELTPPPAPREAMRRSSSIRSIPPLEDLESEPEPEPKNGSSREKKGVGTIIKGLLPQDEGARSTPATVRQLQAEVQRLRQRVQQANAGEERQRADLARVQRLMAVMETQLEEQNGTITFANPEKMEPAPIRRHARSQSAKAISIHRGAEPKGWPGNVCTTPGGTRYQEGVTKPLVDRVVELEEKLVKSSMENATAKQDYLTMKLRNSQLEKTAQRLRHELDKSEAMNDLLQSEIYRLQGSISPGDGGDGRGWRRWLGGAQEPMPMSPKPIKVSSADTDSPVVVVRNLDNNQLVYAPGRAEFM